MIDADVRSNDGEAEPSFPFDELCEFVEEIREDYAFGLDEFIAVQEVVLGLARDGRLPTNLARLEGYIRPILCSNSKEQADFHRRYTEWLRRPPPLPQGAPSASGKQAKVEWEELRRWNFKLNWFFAALAAFVGILLVASFVDISRSPADQSIEQIIRERRSTERAKPASKPEVVPDAKELRERLPNYLVVLAFAGLLILLPLLGAFLWRKRRADAFLSRGGTQTVPDGETILLRLRPRAIEGGRDMQRTATALRRRVPVAATQLDLYATMQRTAENGGRFTEVRRRRTGIPEYLFLIERKSAHDLQAAWFEQLSKALAVNGVHVIRFYFDADPSVVFQPDPAARPLMLGELQSAYPEHRLGIVADIETLMSHFGRGPAPFVKRLCEWPEPVLFTLEAKENWGSGAILLNAAGLPVVGADLKGLETAWGEQRAPARKVESSLLRPLLPKALRDEPRRWLAPQPPEPSVFARVLEQLRRYLGETGYAWLGACAMYPQLRWPLALELGWTTLSTVESSARAETERRFVRLPWCRSAYLPQWLRRRLLDDMPAAEHDRLQGELQRILVEAAHFKAGGQALRIDRDDATLVRSLFDRLTRYWARQGEAESPLADRVFFRSMRRGLAVRLPRALRSLARAATGRGDERLPPRSLSQCCLGAMSCAFVVGLPFDEDLVLVPALAVALLARLGLPPHLASAEPQLAFMARLATGIRLGWRGVAVVLGAFAGVLTAPSPPLGLACIGALGLYAALFGKPVSGMTLRRLARWIAIVTGVVTGLIVLGSVAYAIADASEDALLVGLGATVAILVLLGAAATSLLMLVAAERALVRVSALALRLAALPLPGLPGLVDRARRGLDRWSVDRLLLDRSDELLTPSRRGATALGAAGVGVIFGAALSVDLDTADGIGSFLFVLAAVALYLAHPYFAVLRYATRPLGGSLARAAFEYFLCTGIAMAVWQPSPLFPGLALLFFGALVNFVVAALAVSLVRRRAVGRRFPEFFERTAPDRLWNTRPRFFGFCYLFLLPVAIFLRGPEVLPLQRWLGERRAELAGAAVDDGKAEIGRTLFGLPEQPSDNSPTAEGKERTESDAGSGRTTQGEAAAEPAVAAPPPARIVPRTATEGAPAAPSPAKKPAP